MFLNAPDAHILAAVRASFRSAPPPKLGVAVSGGGDSVALLHALTRCFEPGQVELHAATVDHGLRPAARDEAARVAELCDRLGVPHTVLTWSGWDGSGNLQAEARRARYRLLGDWLRKRGVTALALGHTADDQAETFLMRLSRSAGVDGLSGMRPVRTAQGVTLIRPLLSVTREELRGYLRRNQLDWSEDPSNSDTRFSRVRARNALEALGSLGLTAKTLSEVADNMASARAALDWYTFLGARDIATVEAGDIFFDLRQLRTFPEEIMRRLLIGAIGWITGADYPPRRTPLAAALDVIRESGSTTMSGCVVMRDGETVRICREPQAVAAVEAQPGEIWDGRWRLTGPAEPGMTIRALGLDALSLCPDWKSTGRPRTSLAATPAVWRGSDLAAAPLAGLGQGWVAELTTDAEQFFSRLLSH